MNRQEAGLNFLQQVIAKLPEEKRAAMTTVLEEAPEVAGIIGEGVLRQDEFSRGMDNIRQTEARQTQWWEANQPLVDLGQKAKEAGFDPAKPGTSTSALPDDVVRTAHIQQAERDFVAYNAFTQTLSNKHFVEFGEPLDLTALISDPRLKQGASLQQVYDATVSDRRNAKAQEAVDKRIADGIEAGLRARNTGDPRYPSRAIPGGSPLDALQPVAGNGADVQDLVDAYYEVAPQAAR